MQQGAEKTFLTEGELARRWGRSTRTLQRWRQRGKGPAWMMIVGRVTYDLADVLAFEASSRKEPSEVT